MKRLWFVLLAGVLLGSALAQQAQPEEALTAEQRIERLERVLIERTMQNSPTLSANSLEGRLLRLEARVERLEQQSLRSSSVGGGDRYLESRVSALERQISQIRR